jgi:hypothetical protein
MEGYDYDTTEKTIPPFVDDYYVKSRLKWSIKDLKDFTG